jgi:hypothetical protein
LLSVTIKLASNLNAISSLSGAGQSLQSLIVSTSALLSFVAVMSTSSLWYYHKEARAFGPVEGADIGGLLARNEIAADTLVWRDGLSNWTEAHSTELSSFFSDAGLPPSAVSIVPQSRRKHSKVFWLLFSLAEIFNFLIFGVPLFVAFVLSAGGAVIPTVKAPTDTSVQQQELQPQANQIPE